MIHLRKLSCILLAATLMFSVAACGSKPASEGTGTTNATTAPFEKFDPPLRIRSVLDIPADFTYPAGDTAENNLYTKAFAEELGIEITYDWVTYSGNYNERIKMMISSNDLADVFKIADRPTFNTLVESGLIADLTTAFDQCASDNLKGYLPKDSVARNASTSDGKLYGIPNYNDPKEASTMLWIRTDWLDNLGLSIPTTGEELLAVAEAFAKNDPDGNGVDDTYAFTFDGSLGVGDIYWNMFASYPKIWINDESGSKVHGMFGNETQIANTRQGLLALQELYAKGVIDPEFATKDTTAIGEAAANNKFGMFFDSLWGGYGTLQLNVSANEDARWLPIPIPSMTGEPAKVSGEAVYLWEFHVARKDFSNPEALVQLINLFDKYNSDPATADMAKWNTDPVSNSFTAKLAPVMLFDPLFNLNCYTRIADAFSTNDPSKVSAVDQLFYDQILESRGGNRELWCVDASYGPEGSLSICKYYADNGLTMPNAFTDIPTQNMQEKQPIIDKQWLETQTNVIMGADIATFDAFIAGYDAAGGDVLFQEVNK